MGSDSKTPNLEQLREDSRPKEVEVTEDQMDSFEWDWRLIIRTAGDDIAALEARHADEIKRAVRAAYEDADAMVGQLGWHEPISELRRKLREKAGE